MHTHTLLVMQGTNAPLSESILSVIKSYIHGLNTTLNPHDLLSQYETLQKDAEI